MFPPFLALLRHVRPNICTEIQCKAEASHTSIDQTVESQYFHMCTICIFSFICACWLGLRCAHIHTDRQMASCAFFFILEYWLFGTAIGRSALHWIRTWWPPQWFLSLIIAELYSPCYKTTVCLLLMNNLDLGWILTVQVQSRFESIAFNSRVY